VSASSDLTNLYNRPSMWTLQNAAMAIRAASRTIVWLNGDYVVIYDRATSSKRRLFKRENFELVDPPAVRKSVVTEVTPKGQELYFQSLLPTHRSIAYTETAKKLSFVAWMEPTRYTLTIQDPSKPANTRFLTVLQGANKGTPMVIAHTVHSIGGTPFDGVKFGSSEVYFIRKLSPNFRSTTLKRPAKGTVLLVTGLPAKTHLHVMTNAHRVRIEAGGSSKMTDSSGVLRLTF
jgi:hypothetical protein